MYTYLYTSKGKGVPHSPSTQPRRDIPHRTWMCPNKQIPYMNVRRCQPHPINSNNNNVNNDGSGRPQPSLAQAIKLKQYIILGSFHRSRPGPAVSFGRSKLVRCESSLDANETLYDHRIWERTFWVHNSIQRTIVNFNLIHELRVSPT